jgi:ribonuclease-3
MSDRRDESSKRSDLQEGAVPQRSKKKASSDSESGFLRSVRQLLSNVLPSALPDPRSRNSSQPAAATLPATLSTQRLQELESRIGYRFRDRSLLVRALTHRSYANEQPLPRPIHNEAFEFLGDAVLEFLISTWLLERFPTLSEGPLSKMRAFTVSAVNLHQLALKLEIGQYLLLNRGEEKTGGREKVALQVDAYEALIAAIYLDGGVEVANRFVRREFAEMFAQIDPADLTPMDYKTSLQERLQSLGLPPPRYEILERQGPDHRRVFHVALTVQGHRLATGEGTSLKAAHQAAAKFALTNLEEGLQSLANRET